MADAVTRIGRVVDAVAGVRVADIEAAGDEDLALLVQILFVTRQHIAHSKGEQFVTEAS